MDEPVKIPNHVGYIVDGNRRWAKKHALPTYEGHLAGYNAIKEVAFESFDLGAKYVSAYIFSTENWKRSEEEVSHLMNLALKLFTSDLHFFIEKNLKIKVLGSRKRVDKKIVKAIDEAEAKTVNNTGGMLAICFNYGGRLEITDAVKKIIKDKVPAEKITPDLIEQNLYVPELPEADLIVRTSGEQRISNFLLWRSAYSELIFVKKMFPDMRKADVKKIFKEYANRFRRFGG